MLNSMKYAKHLKLTVPNLSVLSKNKNKRTIQKRPALVAILNVNILGNI